MVLPAPEGAATTIRRGGLEKRGAFIVPLFQIQDLFAKLFEPAIRYGREGFLVSATIAGQWDKQVAELKGQPGFAEAFLRGGRAPAPGEVFTFPEHAATLEKIAATKGAAFYSGELAEKMEAHSKAHGGVMRVADLAANRPDWVGTLQQDYRGYTIHEIPPNGQGIVALIALGILQHFDMGSVKLDSADFFHLEIEAIKLAFADAQAYVADIDHMPFKPGKLLDPGYLKERAKLIDPKKAQPFAAGKPENKLLLLWRLGLPVVDWVEVTAERWTAARETVLAAIDARRDEVYAALYRRDGTLLGSGRNQRVQRGDPSVHGETDAFRKAGRQRRYQDTIMVTTLAPCWYCSGLVRQFNIGTVVVGESRTFQGGIDWLRENGVNVIDLDNQECVDLLGDFISRHPDIWNEDIGEEDAPA